MRGWSSGQAAHCWQNNKNAPAVSVASPGPAQLSRPGLKTLTTGELLSRGGGDRAGDITLWHKPRCHLSIISANYPGHRNGLLLPTPRSLDAVLTSAPRVSDIDLRLLLPLCAPARPGLRGLGPASANQRPRWGPSDQSEARSGRWAHPGDNTRLITSLAAGGIWIILDDIRKENCSSLTKCFSHEGSSLYFCQKILSTKLSYVLRIGKNFCCCKDKKMFFPAPDFP